MRSLPTRAEVAPCAAAAVVGAVAGFLIACGAPIVWPACSADEDCASASLRCEAGQCVERCSPLEHLCGDRCARCCDDGECHEGERCDTDAGTCLERCDFPEHFCGGRCAECCADRECRPGERCGLDAGVCELICPGQQYCPDAGGGGTCQQCCVDADCGMGAGSGFACNQGTCRCPAGTYSCNGRACIPDTACCNNPDCEFFGEVCDGGYCCDTVGDAGCRIPF